MNSPRFALLLSGLVSFVALGAAMAITGAAVPVYERMFGIPTATAGLLVSALWLACLAGVVTMYFVSEHVTPRMALSGMVVGSALLAVAPNWSLTLVGAAVFGFGYGLSAAVFNARLLVSWGQTGPSKVSMLNAVFSAGAIAAPGLFGLIGGDLRPVYWGMAGLSALGWVLSGPAGQVGLVSRAEAGGLRLNLPVLAFAALGVACEASLAGLGPSALIRAGLSEGKAATLLSLFFIAALVARLGLVLFAHRLADFAVYVIAVAWAAVCGLGAATLSAAFFFPLLGVSAGLFFQGAFVPATRKMGADPRVSPIILGVGLVGATLGPQVFARTMDGLGSHGFFWLVAGLMGATTLAALASWRGMAR
ncbi:hypothetical protein NX862_05600 [Rhodobacter sp. KR11]|uniref:MFS transporter n=1 Tax=Rhodobacter sp. KR11 TaxID=2974588 RepID=UPI00222389EF|nr:hypothetical protein [Rhodobacter sp. KR11]MCW1918218.1 hypothetical protein [Rhodobacter sp. KR11]